MSLDCIVFLVCYLCCVFVEDVDDFILIFFNVNFCNICKKFRRIINDICDLDC